MKKTKAFSIILAAMMVLAMLPQCVLAADVNITAFDNALGNLADKGQKYVTDGALPTSVEIDGTTYPVTYVSTNGGVITSTGKVNHGLSFAYVTVTPQISVAGNTVSGTSQELIVMPSGSVEFIEDFEHSDFAPEAGATEKVLNYGSTYNGWTKNLNNTSTVKVKTGSKSRFLLLESTNKQSAQVKKSLSASDEGITIFAFRGSICTYGAGQQVALYPYALAQSNNGTKGYQFRATGDSETTTNEISTDWIWTLTEPAHDFVFVRTNSDTPANVVTEIFVDGVSKGSFKGETGANKNELYFWTQATKADNSLMLDDIIVMNVATPEIKLADKGEKYVTADSLPTSVTLGGVEYGVTYTSSNTNVIAANGKVNHGIGVDYVTVTPQLNANGAAISCASQELIVMPSGSVTLEEDFEGDVFKPDTDATEKVLSAGTYNGWNVTTASGNTVTTLKDDSAESRYLKMYLDTKNAAAPSIKKAMNTPDSGITVFAFDAKFAFWRQGNIGWIKPFAGINTRTYNLAYKISADGTDSGIAIETREVWHEYVFVRKNSSIAENVTTEVFMDGVSVGSFTGDGGFEKTVLEIIDPSATTDGNALSIDNLLVMNVAIDDIKIADKGNSYVVGDSLPSTVTIGGESCNVTYESSNSAVIDAEGNVTHSDSFVYVDVTPTVTLAGSEFVCKTQKLLVMPLSYDEALFEDFESFTEGSLIDGDLTAPNGWKCGNFYDAAYDEYIDLNIDNDEEHGKYFRLEIEKTGAVVNPVFSKNFDDRENGKTLIGFRANVNPYYTALNKEIRINPIGEFATTFLKGGNDSQVHSVYTTNSWQDILFVVDNAGAVKNGNEIYKKADIYVNGELKAEDYYFTNWISALEITAWRGAEQSILLDDIVVAHIDASEYIVTDIKQTNDALTGFIVAKMNASAKTAKAYAAMYDTDGKLTASDVFDLSFNGNTATVSEANVSLANAASMKIFVWTDALEPVAEKVERVLQLETPTLHLIGDSTVCDWTTTNKHGWGTYIGDEFNSGSVAVNNRAVSGKSAKTFMDEGYFDLFSGNIKSGDVLIIQLGSNDKGYNVALNEYKSYLEQYVDIARKKGAYPVLVTLPTQIDSIDNGILTDSPSSVLNLTLADYCEVINNVASEKNVPMIDLYTAMGNVYSSVGSETFKTYYVDQTHFSESGAKLIAGIVADGIKNAQPVLYIANKVK